ncbi:hypothetical protein [Legionella cardiaca]|uniref:VipE n=1 Tax=Legionella cardiaca TaxID=1071983 RepID=A0ABY8AVK7_9GAMM|nr:hypothetical protein [Legionella cardiaca]WED43540.1 hypothetical protein PXX05_01840 [Legionella cardiaca]
MISMTTYWQLFQDYLINLPASPGNQEYLRQHSTAKAMIKIGLGIEQLGITEIKQVVNKLHEKAKLFHHRVAFSVAEEKYFFYLPKITTQESLMFAIIYYQHLKAYANVSYQGSITFSWFKQIIINGVNEKKVTTRLQSMALLEEIKKYCQNQHIDLDEPQLTRADSESIKDYVARVVSLCSVELPANNVTPSDETVGVDATKKLEDSLQALTEKKDQVISKINSLSQRLTTFHMTTENYIQFNHHWSNTFFITKFYYWLISFLYRVPQIENLKAIQKQYTTSEIALKEEFTPYESAETYRLALNNQLEEITKEYAHTQEQLTQSKLEQLKQQQESAVKPNLCAPPSEKESLDLKEDTDELIEEDLKGDSISAADFYYGFFKEHLPSRYTVQAIAVGAAAIVTQQLLY